MKKVINRGKSSKTLNKVKPVKHINKNLRIQISEISIPPEKAIGRQFLPML